MNIVPVAHESSESIVLKSRIETAEIEPNLFAFERTLSMEGKQDGLLSAHTWPVKVERCGFVDEENLQKLLNNQSFERRKLSVWTDDEIERARCEGFHKVFTEEQIRRSPLAFLKAHPDLTIDNVVFADGSCHMLFDRHGVPLPLAVDFNYIDSGIDEGHFDLEGLAAALLKLPGIQVTSTSSFAQEPPTTAREAIYRIPSYNASEDREYSVQFVWQPTREDYLRVWEWANKKGAFLRMMMCRGFFALNLYGLNQFSREPAAAED